MKEIVPSAVDFAPMLCGSLYFDVFNGFIREGCRHLWNFNPEIFTTAIGDILSMETADLMNPHSSKLAYFDFAKEVNI
jgi:hypothetical protein